MPRRRNTGSVHVVQLNRSSPWCCVGGGGGTRNSRSGHYPSICHHGGWHACWVSNADLVKDTEKSTTVGPVAWIILMFAAVSASTASFKALPTPVPCQSTTLLGSCGLKCSVGLPFRAGQAAFSVPVRWNTQLFQYSIFFVSSGSLLTTWFILGKTRQTGEDLSLDVLGNNGISPESQQQQPARSLNFLRLLPYLGGVLVIFHVVIIELLLLGKHHVPFGEDFSSIGQWGPLVGAFLRPFWRSGEGRCRQSSYLAW